MVSGKNKTNLVSQQQPLQQNKSQVTLPALTRIDFSKLGACHNHGRQLMTSLFNALLFGTKVLQATVLLPEQPIQLWMFL
ncbi:conserved hypothetical protein [Ricinus communis]|uniref:Uncharacterized protein n=1 Tax=Ricinus communis TaxID=3988 RepID=B9S0U5_RICCO|nr:conserved hypothetical protein [Ricinus communis]